MSTSKISEFLHELGRYRSRTLKVVIAIPPENIEWRHADNTFSFGDIIRHLADIARFVYAKTSRFKAQCYPGHSAEFASGYDETINYFKRLHD